MCDSEIYQRAVRGSHIRSTWADGAAVSSSWWEATDEMPFGPVVWPPQPSLGAASTSRSPSTGKLRRTPDVSVLVKTHRAASVDIHEEIVVPSRPTSGRPTISSSTTS